MTTRRNFLTTVSTAVATLASGGWALLPSFEHVHLRESLSPSDASPVRLGIAAYSFRSHFRFNKGKTQTPQNGQEMDMFGFIDYCADQRCGAELTSYFFPPDADDEYFLRVKRYAFKKGVPIIGTAIGNNFTIGKGEKLDQQILEAKRWIDRASLMGAPHIRFFAGTGQQLESASENLSVAIAALQSCVDHAASKGIFVGVENHGNLTAQQILTIVKGIRSDWFGINLDTGNFISDDPYQDLTLCAPLAVNVQLKMKMKRPNGEVYDADFDRIATILAIAGYRGYVVLEYEEAEPMTNVPAALARMRKAFDVIA
jgi:sugar phosphate isomerase/epimerase